MAAFVKSNHIFPNLLLLFFVTRALLETIGILSVFFFPSIHSTDLKYHLPQPVFLEIWARWDSEWYIMIAEKGYVSQEAFQDDGKGRYLREDTAKFFPLYPAAIRAFNLVTRNSVLSGFLLSNLAAIVFLYYLGLLVSKLAGQESAFQSGLFYVLFPTSFFLSAVYAESFFLAGLTACFYYLEEKRLWPAALFCVLTMLTRPQGILAFPAILWLAINRISDRRALALIVMALSGMIPLIVFGAFVHVTFGSFRWIADSQQYWRGDLNYPLYAFVRFFESKIAIHGQHNSLIDFVVALLHLLVLIFSFRKIPGPYYLYSLLVLLVPLSTTLFSFSRLCLANLPFFLFLGTHATGRWRVLIQIAFAMFLAFFMAAFANWYWVG